MGKPAPLTDRRSAPPLTGGHAEDMRLVETASDLDDLEDEELEDDEDEDEDDD